MRWERHISVAAGRVARVACILRKSPRSSQQRQGYYHYSQFLHVMVPIQRCRELAVKFCNSTSVLQGSTSWPSTIGSFHLLVIPLTPFEIAMSKVWANGSVITVAVGLSPYVVIRGMLAIPIAGSIPLFMIGDVIYLFFATAIGIFLGTVARSMPQLGLLYTLVYLPMNMLSGSNTPLESMPPWLATVMQASPPTHFVLFAQSILYRGTGLDVVWPQFLAVAVVGGLFLASQSCASARSPH